jgi:hypothetical protein
MVEAEVYPRGARHADQTRVRRSSPFFVNPVDLPEEEPAMRTARMWKWSLTVAVVLWARMAWAASVVVTTHPYHGITYITRSDTVPRAVIMHIVEVDLTAPGIAFEVTGPSGARETTRQTTLDFLNQTRAQVAVNTHFFSTDLATDTWLAGLAASKGSVYSSFDAQPAAAGQPDQSYAIVPYVAALNIDSANHAAIVHRDANFPDNKHVRESVTLWNTVSGSAQIVTNGVKTIPAYKDETHPQGELAPNATYSNSHSWYASVPRARTAVGLSQDNTRLILFTVDETGGSSGMTPDEVASLLIRDYGAYNALNLDGGGSTTLAMQDPLSRATSVVNASSGGPRAVGGNLAVFAAERRPPQLVTVKGPSPWRRPHERHVRAVVPRRRRQ